MVGEVVGEDEDGRVMRSTASHTPSKYPLALVRAHTQGCAKTPLRC